ncbi:MAG TPA: MEDS domain-containing protein [Gemmatimonadaceae bacterium]|nr:MEDS domain-containing protein [Gemmatimonadaceae bacterium]
MSAPRKVTLCGRALDEPGHICAFFDSRTEEYDILAPYYKEGIELDERVITIVDSHRQADHRARLASKGIDVPTAVNDGRLAILTAEETYMKGGKFGAERMYEMLQGALAEAEQDGRRVRTSGVMDWALNGAAGTEELMEYESRVNFLVPKYDCTLLCVYDINEISGRMMMEILSTHPYIVHGRRVRENPYYVQPIDRLREVLLPTSGPVAASGEAQLS